MDILTRALRFGATHIAVEKAGSGIILGRHTNNLVCCGKEHEERKKRKNSIDQCARPLCKTRRARISFMRVLFVECKLKGKRSTKAVGRSALRLEASSCRTTMGTATETLKTVSATLSPSATSFSRATYLHCGTNPRPTPFLPSAVDPQHPCRRLASHVGPSSCSCNSQGNVCRHLISNSCEAIHRDDHVASPSTTCYVALAPPLPIPTVTAGHLCNSPPPSCQYREPRCFNWWPWRVTCLVATMRYTAWPAPFSNRGFRVGGWWIEEMRRLEFKIAGSRRL